MLSRAVAVIETGGFDTIQITCADLALGILEHRSDIRVVSAEIDTPGDLNALRLARIVRARRPLIEFVFTSPSPNPTSERLPVRSRFIAKPYEAGDLNHVLRSFRLWHPGNK